MISDSGVAAPVKYSNAGNPILMQPLIPSTASQTPPVRLFRDASGKECFGTVYTKCRKGMYHSHNCTNCYNDIKNIKEKLCARWGVNDRQNESILEKNRDFIETISWRVEVSDAVTGIKKWKKTPKKSWAMEMFPSATEVDEPESDADDDSQKPSPPRDVIEPQQDVVAPPVLQYGEGHMLYLQC